MKQASITEESTSTTTIGFPMPPDFQKDGHGHCRSCGKDRWLSPEVLCRKCHDKRTAKHLRSYAFPMLQSALAELQRLGATDNNNTLGKNVVVANIELLLQEAKNYKLFS